MNNLNTNGEPAKPRPKAFWGRGIITTARLKDVQPGQGIRPGRPTDPRWTEHPKVPLSPDVVTQLKELAAEMERTHSRKLGFTQTAAILIEQALAYLKDADGTHLAARIRDGTQGLLKSNPPAENRSLNWESPKIPMSEVTWANLKELSQHWKNDLGIHLPYTRLASALILQMIDVHLHPQTSARAEELYRRAQNRDQSEEEEPFYIRKVFERVSAGESRQEALRAVLIAFDVNEIKGFVKDYSAGAKGIRQLAGVSGLGNRVEGYVDKILQSLPGGQKRRFEETLRQGRANRIRDNEESKAQILKELNKRDEETAKELLVYDRFIELLGPDPAIEPDSSVITQIATTQESTSEVTRKEIRDGETFEVKTKTVVEYKTVHTIPEIPSAKEFGDPRTREKNQRAREERAAKLNRKFSGRPLSAGCRRTPA
ncbi:MAG TPA: hypothetical protein VG796_24785 [Verrucomicrobiales bacterium]|nr:hypothetical protein [Verrucomicrobiales bacterium]